MRLLGVDHGLSKVGLALGDTESKVSAPLDVVARDIAVDAIKALVNEEQIALVVAGDPTGYGSAPQQEDLQSFLEELRGFVDVVLVDEGFTTSEGIARREKGSSVSDDALAAHIILESYLATL